MGPELFGGDDVELEDLPPGEELGRGGQGVVNRVTSGPYAGLALKRYTLPGSDPKAMSRLVRAPTSLSPAERGRLFRMSSWPLARVMSKGRPVGVLMREVPATFVARTKSGASQLLGLKYLIYERKPLWGDIHPPDIVGLLTLVKSYVSLFQLLHSRSLVVGDVSMNNLLWSCEGGEHDVFLLDCDGVRKAGEKPVLPQPETPDWDDPRMPTTGLDLDTDRYKLALLVGRVLSRQPTVRPGRPLALLPGLPEKVAQAVERRFADASGAYGTRPDAWQWGIALGGRSEVKMSTQQLVEEPDLPLAPLQGRTGPRSWTPLNRRRPT